ncbi:MAG TPA: hypothetical protein G4O02_08910 [Caldilineae bacterium]|nr:hypothetical protein [Caldilineae bacterium]
MTISVVVHQALKTLARRLEAAEQAPSQRERLALSAALEYLGQAREGFFLSLRTGAVPDRSELAYLVRQALVDWQWLEELGIDLEEPSQIERVRSQLIAFAMAAIAIGMMPRLPPEQVTFPSFRPLYTARLCGYPRPALAGAVTGSHRGSGADHMARAGGTCGPAGTGTIATYIRLL